MTTKPLEKLIHTLHEKNYTFFSNEVIEIRNYINEFNEENDSNQILIHNLYTPNRKKRPIAYFKNSPEARIFTVAFYIRQGEIITENDARANFLKNKVEKNRIQQQAKVRLKNLKEFLLKWVNVLQINPINYDVDLKSFCHKFTIISVPSFLKSTLINDLKSVKATYSILSPEYRQSNCPICETSIEVEVKNEKVCRTCNSCNCKYMD